MNILCFFRFSVRPGARFAAAALCLAVFGASPAFASDAYVQAVRTSGSAGHALVTDYYPNPKTKIVVDFQYDDISNDGRLFGVCRLGTSVGLYRNAGTVDGISSPFVLENSGSQVGMMVSDTDRHVATFDFSKAGSGSSIARADGTVQWTGGPTAATAVMATHPLVIFGTATANGTHGTVGYFASAKIYSFKIFEEDALVRDYVPAARDGLHGLYDRVGGLFLASGTADSDLGYGGDVLELPGDDPYVESTGTQAVNTGIYMDNTTRMEIDFALTETAQSGSVAGGWNYTGFNRLCFPYLNGGQFKYAWGGADDDTGGNWAFLAGPAQDTLRHRAVIDAPGQRLSLVGVSSRYYNVYHYDYDHATPAPWPIFLFGNSGNAEGTAYGGGMNGKARIYGARIWQGGTLVRDFVPAVKGGETGLVDRVSGRVFSDWNRNGGTTGTDLVASANIPEVEDDGYVEAAGNSIVVTGYSINPKTKLVVDFARTYTKKDERLFGVFKGNGSVDTYQSGGKIYVAAGSGSTYNNNNTGIAPDTRRHTLTVDLSGGTSSFVSGATTNWSAIAAGTPVTTEATFPLDIFSTSCEATGKAGNSTVFKSFARMYRFQIWEVGDEGEPDRLVHDYVPYVKQDVAGFLDAVDGTSFLASSYGDQLTGGGAIAGEKDAYVQAVRASKNAINTGYYVKPTTKFVVDFQYDDNGNDGRIFGSYNPAASRVGLYGNSADVGKFRVESSGGQLDTAVTRDTQRHVAVLDYSKANGGSSISTDGTAVWTGGPKGAVTAEGTNPVILFGTHTGTPGYYASAKIYSFKIYEGDSLVHEYLPYKNGDTVSFYDTVDGAVLANNAGTSTAFGYGGKGVDGAERWLKALPATATVPVEGTTTLTAAASGAIRYKWTKNGETIEGATGETCAAAWCRGHYGTPDVYACTAIYDVYGREVEGEPVSCEVSRIPEAFVLVVR